MGFLTEGDDLMASKGFVAGVALSLMISGCSSIKVTNSRNSALATLTVTQASSTENGYTCPSSGANILAGPLAPGYSHTVSGLTPGRYCVNGSQVDVPIIGQVEVFIR